MHAFAYLCTGEWFVINTCTTVCVGVGDFRVADVEQLPDPCPTPEMEKRRSLNQKERLVYAPMSGVGGILYDKDAVYINVGGSHYFDSEETEVGVMCTVQADILVVGIILGMKMMIKEM